MANEYFIGQKVRIGGTFTVNGAVTDPTAVTLKIRDPFGVVGTYTFAGGSVIKDSTGVYHMDYIANIEGWYHYEFAGSGAVTAVTQDEWRIRETMI